MNKTDIQTKNKLTTAQRSNSVWNDKKCECGELLTYKHTETEHEVRHFLHIVPEISFHLLEVFLFSYNKVLK